MSCLRRLSFAGLLTRSIILSYFALATVRGIQRFNAYNKYYVEDECTTDEDLFYKIDKTGKYTALKIEASRFSLSTQEKNCNVNIQSPADSGIILNLVSMSFGTSTFFYDCTKYIQIFGEMGNSSKVCGFLKWTSGVTSFVSLRDMRFKYFTDGLVDRHSPSHFTLVATAYTNGSPECPEDTFRCDSGHCIWEGFVCDKEINCPDGSDELVSSLTNCTGAINLNNTSPIEIIDVPSSGFIPSSPSSYTAVHVGGTVGFIFLAIVAVFIRFFCLYSCARTVQFLCCVRARNTEDQTCSSASPPPYITLVEESTTNVTGSAGTGTSSENPPPYSSRLTSTSGSENDVAKQGFQNVVMKV